MRYTITAALPYSNGPIHIGHLAGVYLPADIYYRYLKLKGEDAIFICGSDEHGVPITLKSREEGVSPQDIVDKYHKINKQSFEEFGIIFDIYSRTSSKVHKDTAQEFFTVLNKKNIFEIHETKQYFDEKEGIFLADRYITGSCPKCDYSNAYGDQCEKCGITLSPQELVNPKSTISNTSPILKKTKHWYLPLNKYQDKLKKWILEDNKDWKSNVYGQCKSWLDDGLKPRAVTRDLSWGVQVPLKDAEGKVLYVWFDAPIGYISSTKEWAQKDNGRLEESSFVDGNRSHFNKMISHNKNDNTPKDWKPYWKDKDTKLIHFIGKDNIVFHCIIFPSMLIAHGDYILPTNVPANEFMNLEGQKISTSRNWAVWLPDYLKKYPGKQDVLRYVLCCNTPETKDSDFTWQDFKTRNNSELVAIMGNYVNRTVILANKYFNALVPQRKALTAIDETLINEINLISEKIAHSLDNFKFREGVAHWLEIARIGNKYLAETEPWKIKDMERVGSIMNCAIQIVANIYIASKIFMPFTAQKLANILCIDQSLGWSMLGKCDIIKPKHEISKQNELLFEKIE